jgi:hypothetical protein
VPYRVADNRTRRDRHASRLPRTTATTIDVVWPTAATCRVLSPLKIPPTTTSRRRSTAAAIRAGHVPYRTAAAMAATTTYDGPTSIMRESDSGSSPCAMR